MIPTCLRVKSWNKNQRPFSKWSNQSPGSSTEKRLRESVEDDLRLPPTSLSCMLPKYSYPSGPCLITDRTVTACTSRRSELKDHHVLGRRERRMRVSYHGVGAYEWVHTTLAQEGCNITLHVLMCMCVTHRDMPGLSNWRQPG